MAMFEKNTTSSKIAERINAVNAQIEAQAKLVENLELTLGEALASGGKSDHILEQIVAQETKVSALKKALSTMKVEHQDARTREDKQSKLSEIERSRKICRNEVADIVKTFETVKTAFQKIADSETRFKTSISKINDEISNICGRNQDYLVQFNINRVFEVGRGPTFGQVNPYFERSGAIKHMLDETSQALICLTRFENLFDQQVEELSD